VSIGPALALDGQSLDLTNWIPAPTLAVGDDFIGYGEEYGFYYGGSAAQPSGVTPTAIEIDGLPMSDLSKRRIMGMGNAQLRLNFDIQDYQFAQNYFAESPCAKPLIKNVAFDLTLYCASIENMQIAFGASKLSEASTQTKSENIWTGNGELSAQTELYISGGSADSIVDIIDNQYANGGIIASVPLAKNVDYVPTNYGAKLLRNLPAQSRTITAIYSTASQVSFDWSKSVARNYSIVFHGVNASDNRKVHLEIYRANILPVQSMNMTDDNELQSFVMSGKAKTIKRNGNYEKYRLSIDSGSPSQSRQFVAL
jgi:hypothetical protein